MHHRGFTLIELAVVLAIIAVLAAVLTPVVTGYLDQARIARAQADVRTIADAIKLYRTDTGVYPFFNTIGAAGSPTVANIASDVLASANGSAILGSATGTGWSSATVGTTSLEVFLNTNVMNRSTTATGGRVVYRGPYVGTVEADPWSNKYYVTADNLGSDSSYWAYVVSAGPDGVIATNKEISKTSAFAPSGDDLTAPIR